MNTDAYALKPDQLIIELKYITCQKESDQPVAVIFFSEKIEKKMKQQNMTPTSW